MQAPSGVEVADEGRQEGVWTLHVAEWGPAVERAPGVDEVIASLGQLRAMFLASHIATSGRSWGTQKDRGRQWEVLPLGFRVTDISVGSLEVVVALFGAFAASMSGIATFMAMFNKAAISPMKLLTSWRQERLKQAVLKTEIAKAEREYDRLMSGIPGSPLQLQAGALEDAGSSEISQREPD